MIIVVRHTEMYLNENWKIVVQPQMCSESVAPQASKYQTNENEEGKKRERKKKTETLLNRSERKITKNDDTIPYREIISERRSRLVYVEVITAVGRTKVEYSFLSMVDGFFLFFVYLFFFFLLFLYVYVKTCTQRKTSLTPPLYEFLEITILFQVWKKYFFHYFLSCLFN